MKLAAKQPPMCLWVILEHRLLSLGGPWALASLRMSVTCQMAPLRDFPQVCGKGKMDENPYLSIVMVKCSVHLRSILKMQMSRSHTHRVLIHLRNWHFKQNPGLSDAGGPRIFTGKTLFYRKIIQIIIVLVEVCMRVGTCV